MHRRIWVRRPNASPTQVRVPEDSVVDEVRDEILRKYANSLGRNFDAPDITLRILRRLEEGQRQRHGRLLDPGEEISNVIDECFPEGQTAQDALLVEVTQKQISAPLQYHYDGSGLGDEYRPMEPAVSNTLVARTGNASPLPSPAGSQRSGGSRSKSDRRQSVTSSTAVVRSSNTGAVAVDTPMGVYQQRGEELRAGGVSGSAEMQPRRQSLANVQDQQSALGGSTQTQSSRSRRKKKDASVQSSSPAPSNQLQGTVPAINVLLVDDNSISLRVLQEKMKILKVRWQTATNGQIAVDKWKSAGFHLILMDIKMPVMDGLAATKEIRRLEMVNGIGFGNRKDEAGPDSQDHLVLEGGRFKSPVIIVALTASALQSDRHEALAAGCNDFVTKPINPAWLERKLKEWGSMQALIDFDGWKKWKA